MSTLKIGPSLVFGRLWKESGLPEILGASLAGRRFEFAVERAVFLTVLHRLFSPGSDRAAEVWRGGYAMAGSEELELHHLYRTMGWLGEPLPSDQQAGATPFVPRCTKDLIEEALFARRRDPFSGLDLVFFDTTSIYFEGKGGDRIGQYGKSKDHRPDRKQMAVGAVFRSLKSILETRPIYHKCDDTIRGHVFCSFLALVLMKELQAQMEAAWTT